MQHGLPFLGYQVSIRLPVQLRFCCRWDKKQGNSFTKDRDGREEGRKGGVQKVVLNLLTIGYVQVKTLKFPRPCTLACNCKIIWVSDSGQVGEWSSKFQNHTGREAYEKIMLNFIF